jgi:hypothetical protein
VVKVPVTLGNVDKSYTAVMVTGVGGEADAHGTEAMAKQPSSSKRVVNVVLNVFIFNFRCCFGLL